MIWKTTKVQPRLNSDITVITVQDNVYSFRYTGFYFEDVKWCYTKDLIAGSHIPRKRQLPPMIKLSLALTVLTVVSLLAVIGLISILHGFD